MARAKPKTKAGKRRKVHKVMSEFKSGTLTSGSGGKVKKRKQAVAIALRMAGVPRKKKGRKRGRSKK